jgi:hypothetical protein
MQSGQGMTRMTQWVEPGLTLPGEMAQSELPDCCNDLLTYLSTGQSCKAGQDCATSHTWVLAPPLEVAAVFASTTMPWPACAAGKHATGPQRIWRPPTFA